MQTSSSSSSTTPPLPEPTNEQTMELPFSLIDPESHRMYQPTVEQYQAIYKQFPTSFMINFSPPYLTIVCQTLPAKHPPSIGGLPCLLTTNQASVGDYIGQRCLGPAHMQMQNEKEYPLWMVPPLSDRVEVLSQLPAGVSEIAWIGYRWLLVLDSSSAEELPKELPQTVGTRLCTYTIEKPPYAYSLRKQVGAPESYLCQRLYHESDLGFTECYITGHGCRRIPTNVAGEWEYVETIWVDIRRDGIVDGVVEGCLFTALVDEHGNQHASLSLLSSNVSEIFSPPV